MLKLTQSLSTLEIKDLKVKNPGPEDRLSVIEETG
jgi:hypothetical protein